MTYSTYFLAATLVGAFVAQAQDVVPPVLASDANGNSLVATGVLNINTEDLGALPAVETALLSLPGLLTSSQIVEDVIATIVETASEIIVTENPVFNQNTSAAVGTLVTAITTPTPAIAETIPVNQGVVPIAIPGFQTVSIDSTTAIPISPSTSLVLSNGTVTTSDFTSIETPPVVVETPTVDQGVVLVDIPGLQTINSSSSTSVVFSNGTQTSTTVAGFPVAPSASLIFSNSTQPSTPAVIGGDAVITSISLPGTGVGAIFSTIDVPIETTLANGVITTTTDEQLVEVPAATQVAGDDTAGQDGTNSEGEDGSDSESEDRSDSEGEDGSDSEGEDGSDSEGEDGSDSEGEDGSDSEGEGGSDSEGEDGSDSEGEGGSDLEVEDETDSSDELALLPGATTPVPNSNGTFAFPTGSLSGETTLSRVLASGTANIIGATGTPNGAVVSADGTSDDSNNAVSSYASPRASFAGVVVFMAYLAF